MTTSISAFAATQLRHPERSEAGIVAFGGYLVHAPGFTADIFARAIERGLAEGVVLTTRSRPGTFIASRSGSAMTYVTTRTTCTCWAGRLGRSCKHRALACLILTILDPRARGP